MAEFPDNKFKNMVDEMNRFEEEIGLPYAPEMLTAVPGPVPSQPFVLGTNTFSQAQRTIYHINQGDDMIAPGPFIPAQVMHSAQTDVIPPPPAPPLSMPPAGMRFPPGIPMPYSQPAATASQPSAFPNSLLVGSESAATAATSASSMAFPRKPTAPTPWPNRQPTGKSQTLNKPVETNIIEEAQKVVLSATPKLYTPKVDRAPDFEPTSFHTRFVGVDIPKSSYDMNHSVKKPKPNDAATRYPVVSSYVAAIEAAQADKKKDNKKQKKFIRVSGGQTWEDPTLTEWDDGDFRLFCGDLGNDVTDELLTRIFSRYASFSKAKVVRDKRTNKTKGFGFVSFKDPQDFIRASKEMNGRYVGSRPIKLRKSTWKNRNLDTVKKKEKEKAALIAMLTGK